ILAACGRAPGGVSLGSSFSAVSQLSPSVLGGVDKNLITGNEGTYPNITQSETQSWTNGNTIVAAYNDSKDRNANPICIAGGSYSTDGGTTWTNNHPFCPGHQTNYGDPGVVYDAAHAKWIAVFLATGCGGQGIGVWTSTNGTTWTAPSCAHSGSSDDRESIWVDNHPSSPHHRRTYGARN